MVFFVAERQSIGARNPKIWDSIPYVTQNLFFFPPQDNINSFFFYFRSGLKLYRPPPSFPSNISHEITLFNCHLSLHFEVSIYGQYVQRVIFYKDCIVPGGTGYTI